MKRAMVKIRINSSGRRIKRRIRGTIVFLSLSSLNGCQFR
jgi:hypothetical protein